MNWEWADKSLENFCRENRLEINILFSASGAILCLLAITILGYALIVMGRHVFGHGDYIFWHIWTMGVAATIVQFLGLCLIGLGRTVWNATKCDHEWADMDARFDRISRGIDALDEEKERYRIALDSIAHMLYLPEKVWFIACEALYGKNKS